jgi:hypothetical protein
MKTHAMLSVITLLIMAGCSSAYHTAQVTDDVYYTPGVVRPGAQQEQAIAAEPAYQAAKAVERTQTADTGYEAEASNGVTYYMQEPEVSSPATSTYMDEEGIIINNYYYGDYYDYAYSSRIRRFYRPYASVSSYYDPFFTNMFWYNYDPFYSGVSIYLGYGAIPMYYPGYYWSPYTSYFGMAPFGFPSMWSHYYFGSSYWYGFQSGYYAGYHTRYWGTPYYYMYNSFDRSHWYYTDSNTHYGPDSYRGGTTSTGRRRDVSSRETSFAENFETRTARRSDGSRELIASDTSKSSRTDESGSRRTTTVTALPDEGRQTRTSREGTTTVDPAGRTTIPPATQARTARQGEEQTGRTETRTVPAGTQGTTTIPRSTRTPADYQAPSREQYQRTTEQRYARPQQTTPAGSQTREVQPNYNPPRTYTAPSYQQPRSNEQYRSPQTGRTPAVAPPAGVTPARQQTQPAQQQTRPANQQTQPPARETQQPRVSTPPRQTAPTRNTTPPSNVRSTPPTRSTGGSSTQSVSPPTRSTGSSAGSSSSGSRNTNTSSGSSSGGRRR